MPMGKPAACLKIVDFAKLCVASGTDDAAAADTSAVTDRSSTVLPDATDIPTNASRAALMPIVAPVAEHSTLDATTAAGRLSMDSAAAPTAAAGLTTGPDTADAASMDCVTATGTPPTAPIAAAASLSGPLMIAGSAASANRAVEDAAAAAAAAAVTTTDALLGMPSVSEAVQISQRASPTVAAQPSSALGTSGTGVRVCQPAQPAAGPSDAVSMLTHLAHQIAQALADAAIQLVPQQQQQQQQQQNLPVKPRQQQQQQLKQRQQTQQLQQHRMQNPHQQEQQQQQQQQQQHQQQEQRQQLMAAASSRKLVAAFSTDDASGAALDACVAMTKPVLPGSVSRPGLLPVPAVTMATETPEAGGLSLLALSLASASAASAPAAAAAPTMLPSCSLPQKPNERHSSNSTQPAAVAWPRSGIWPGSQTQKSLHGAVPPVRMGPPPPVQLGPPAPSVLTASVPPPPAAAWPPPPAWPPQWPQLPWGQPPPAPASQYLPPVIAPPAPPPGSPPPQPASGSAALLLPSLPLSSREVAISASAVSAQAPVMPVTSLAQKLKEPRGGDGARSEAVAWPSSGTWPGSQTHQPPVLHGAGPSKAQLRKRKKPAQQQRPAAKRQKAPAGSGRRPHQKADSAGSVGSVNGNASSSKEEDDHAGLSAKKGSAVASRSSGGGGTASTAAQPKPDKRFRQKLRRSSQLAERAQQAYAVASGKVLPGLHAVPHGQRGHQQLPKSQGKQGKGKGQAHRPAQSQKGRKGARLEPSPFKTLSSR